jgi:hypothetical protein
MRTVWGGGVCERSSSPHSSHLPSMDSQLTVSVGGGVGRGIREIMDLERLTFYIDYEAFKQWH